MAKIATQTIPIKAQSFVILPPIAKLRNPTQPAITCKIAELNEMKTILFIERLRVIMSSSKEISEISNIILITPIIKSPNMVSTKDEIAKITIATEDFVVNCIYYAPCHHILGVSQDDKNEVYCKLASVF